MRTSTAYRRHTLLGNSKTLCILPPFRTSPEREGPLTGWETPVHRFHPRNNRSGHIVQSLVPPGPKNCCRVGGTRRAGNFQSAAIACERPTGQEDAIATRLRKRYCGRSHQGGGRQRGTVRNAAIVPGRERFSPALSANSANKVTAVPSALMRAYKPGSAVFWTLGRTSHAWVAPNSGDVLRYGSTRVARLLA